MTYLVIVQQYTCKSAAELVRTTNLNNLIPSLNDNNTVVVFLKRARLTVGSPSQLGSSILTASGSAFNITVDPTFYRIKLLFLCIIQITTGNFRGHFRADTLANYSLVAEKSNFEFYVASPGMYKYKYRRGTKKEKLPSICPLSRASLISSTEL